MGAVLRTVQTVSDPLSSKPESSDVAWLFTFSACADFRFKIVSWALSLPTDLITITGMCSPTVPEGPKHEVYNIEVMLYTSGIFQRYITSHIGAQ